MLQLNDVFESLVHVKILVKPSVVAKRVSGVSTIPSLTCSTIVNMNRRCSGTVFLTTMTNSTRHPELK